MRVQRLKLTSGAGGGGVPVAVLHKDPDYTTDDSCLTPVQFSPHSAIFLLKLHSQFVLP